MNRAGPRWRRRVLLAVAALLSAALLLSGLVAVRGLGVRDHLLRSSVLLGTLRQQVADGDLPAARATLARLREQTSAARDGTSGPLWRLAAHAPVAGDDIGAVATVASVLDDLANDALPPLIEAADRIGPEALAPRRGRIEIGALAETAPRILAADAALTRAADRVRSIRVDGLLPAVRVGIEQLRRELDDASAQTATAARAAGLLPSMLGSAGPRTYLLLFQNLAEVRATGGAPNAFAVVRAERGAIRIVEFGTAAAYLKTFPKPVLPLDRAMRALYSDRLGKFPADVNFTPHFPTAAKLAREMYRRRSGRTVDGVIATDPVALAHLLRATGPVRLPSGGLMTADNAVRLLLSDVYARLPEAAQDDFYAGAAGATFEALTRGRVDAPAALAALGRAARERRILVWSAHPAEQRLLTGTVLEGALPERDEDGPAVGVFLNDGTGAKLGYYLSGSVTVRAGTCRADGRRVLRVAIGLRSSAPRSGLSPSVVGTLGLVPPYTVRTNIMIFSPVGGAVGAVWHDGRPARMGGGFERGRAVGVIRVDLRPGQSSRLDAEVLTGPAPPGANGGYQPRLWTTPTVRPWSITIDSATNCGAVR